MNRNRIQIPLHKAACSAQAITTARPDQPLPAGRADGRLSAPPAASGLARHPAGTRTEVRSASVDKSLTHRLWGNVATYTVPAAIAALVAVESLHMAGTDGWDGAIAASVLLAALVSSIAGFAFALLAGSALAFLPLAPAKIVMTLAVCSIAIQAYAVWQLRASIRWRALWPMLAAGAISTPLGVALLLAIDRRTHAALVGAIVVAFSLFLLLQRRLPAIRGTTRLDAAIGALGGFTGGLVAAPGLVVTIWCSLQGWDKVRQRATFQPFILAMQIVLVGWLGWTAPLQADAVSVARFVPFAMLGAIGGFALFQRLTSRQFQAVVSILLILSGAGLLARLA